MVNEKRKKINCCMIKTAIQKQKNKGYKAQHNDKKILL
jgi:hypothetical protein